jgi:hypothetical protein
MSDAAPLPNQQATGLAVVSSDAELVYGRQRRRSSLRKKNAFFSR